MVEDIKYLIDLVGGPSNALTIFTFLISLFIAFYLYFKTFYRMVYSIERVCEYIKEHGDWAKEQDEFISRVLFYNNGRKTLTKSEVKNLVINSNKEILFVRLLEDSKSIKFFSKKNRININIEYLDSAKYFVLEIKHKGYISVQGRISETGNLLQTEPTYWMIINVVFMFYFVFSLFNILLHIEDASINFNATFLNIVLMIAIFLTVRFIHYLLFIPDSLTAKFLHPKNKLNNEFSNKF